jgi:hypothetical protein
MLAAPAALVNVTVTLPMVATLPVIGNDTRALWIVGWSRSGPCSSNFRKGREPAFAEPMPEDVVSCVSWRSRLPSADRVAGFVGDLNGHAEGGASAERVCDAFSFKDMDLQNCGIVRRAILH